MKIYHTHFCLTLRCSQYFWQLETMDTRDILHDTREAHLTQLFNDNDHYTKLQF